MTDKIKLKPCPFCGDKDLIELSPLDGADWALWWIPDHMLDMQSVACENFAK